MKQAEKKPLLYAHSMQQHMTIIVVSPSGPAGLDSHSNCDFTGQTSHQPILTAKKMTNCYKLGPNLFARLLHTL